MKLSEARICINCDEIHQGEKCPRCGLGPSYWMITWFNPIHTAHLKDNYRKAQETKEVEGEVKA